jgi:hypothetical protein
VPLVGTCLRIVRDGRSTDAAGERPATAGGIVGWALSGLDVAVDEIDGLPTAVVRPSAPAFADHPLGAVGLDHVVVLTSSIDRTSSALERMTRCPLKRVREVGAMRQGFHRIGAGGLIVELVERPEVTASAAAFWGLVVVVEDLDAAVGHLGDRIGAAKDAVQPDRRIATIRPEAGLGLPVALMSR